VEYATGSSTSAHMIPLACITGLAALVWACGADPVAGTPPALEPAPSGVPSVALTVARLAGGSGATLVSSGIPLVPGALRADQLGQVQVWAGGQQQAVYVEALQGRHPDGSVRALLVQFRPALTQGAPVPGELCLGVARTTADLGKTAVTWDVPEGVALPSDPAYLVQTDLVGPTVTVAQAPTSPAFFAAYDARFREFSDYYWNATGAHYDGNYYDRALNHFAYWVRSGTLVYWQRAAAIAGHYRANYLESSGFNPVPHMFFPEGLLLHYWLTGHEGSRQALVASARRVSDVFSVQAGSDPSYRYNEGRIQARALLGCLMALRVGDTSADWGGRADGYLGNWAAQQQADGSFRYRLQTEDANSPLGQSNFMEGLRMDALVKFHQWRRADARIPTLVRRQVDFLWNTQRVADGSFKYWSVDAAGNSGWDLNQLMSLGFAFAYRTTGQASYRTNGDLVFQAGVERSWYQGSKQFNQQYYDSFTYLAYRQ
jgi:hypothetical protein